MSFSAYICARSHQLRRAERWLIGAYATTYIRVLWASEGRDGSPGLTDINMASGGSPDLRYLACAWTSVVTQSQTSTQSLAASGPLAHSWLSAAERASTWLQVVTDATHRSPAPEAAKTEDITKALGSSTDCVHTDLRLHRGWGSAQTTYTNMA